MDRELLPTEEEAVAASDRAQEVGARGKRRVMEVEEDGLLSPPTRWPAGMLGLRLPASRTSVACQKGHLIVR